MIANIHVGTFTTVGIVRTVGAVENEHTTAKIYEHTQHNGATALRVSFTTVCHTLIVHVSSVNEWSIPTMRCAYWM